MALIIDPPSGWKYGFPKPIPEDRRKDSLVWLVEQGYPQSLIDYLGEHFYCRYWEDDSYLHRKDKADIGDIEHNSPNQSSDKGFGEIETEEKSSFLHKKQDKAIIKFNGGRLALLCSNCRVIIKEGKDFSYHEKQFTQGDVYLPPQYCEQCSLKRTI